jgi:hypothetical protein
MALQRKTAGNCAIDPPERQILPVNRNDPAVFTMFAINGLFRPLKNIDKIQLII